MTFDAGWRGDGAAIGASTFGAISSAVFVRFRDVTAFVSTKGFFEGEPDKTRK